MKLRHLLAVLLLLHLLVHPALHAFPEIATEAGVEQAHDSSGRTVRLDDFSCISCRTAVTELEFLSGLGSHLDHSGEHLFASISHSYSGWPSRSLPARAPPAA